MRIEANWPLPAPVWRVRHAHPINRLRPDGFAVRPLGTCDVRGAIPFSKYLLKHNRQDRDDLTRAALPAFGAPGAPHVGGTLDVLG
jgi:hypothetical protein